ncbi:unnamed protein product [Rhizoctonia solani]|uniref:Uncharacterized protein n=1 Tax=Rhizoctonia solani TaxID=456999 RepID=A0A8H3BI38_9AGAM|nr:unnamed protein product [Rhizoctonia solani]
MPLPKIVQKRALTLTKNFDKCTNRLQRLYAAGRYDEYLALRKGELTAIYKDACTLLREADTTGASYRADLLDAVQYIIDEDIGEEEAADICCLTLKPQDYRDEPAVVEDQRIGRNPAEREYEDDDDDEDVGPKPHPKANPSASFSLELTELTATPANRSAMPIYDARCEVSSVRDRKSRYDGRHKSDFVIDMQTSSGGSCLAVLGWVETKVLQPRDHRRTGTFPAPWISYHFPDDHKSKFTNFMKGWGHRLEVGLTGVARHMTLDESQRLIFVADQDRIKSFEWATPNGSYHTRPLAMHTLNSKHFNGPIAALPNGFLIRAGAGSAGVWGLLNQLDIHGPQGDQIIGSEIHIDDEYEYEYDSDLDDISHLEYSSGSPCTSEVTFADDPELKPDVWRVLPHSPSTVLATGRKERSCVAIDLEHGGKTITRYQGHPGFVSGVSISAADPHVFLTSSCQDEYARLFDVRRPQAVLKFAACEPGKECGAISLAHPDGIPTVFTASRYNQDFKVWDVRSRACAYELGTDECRGSSVRSFAWDAGHNSLYSLRSAFDNNDGYSEDSDDGGNRAYNRIYRYSFKDEPQHSTLCNDNAKAAAEE